MDLLPLGFLLVVVLVSGFIAWVADQVGKKLGKKRLSIWGLRPRHTAALGTALMGILISFFTILLVAALSSDVRDWITKGRRAIVELRHAEGELRKTQNELTEKQRQLISVQEKFDQDQKQIASLEGQIGRGAHTLADQQASIKSLKQQQGAMQRRLLLTSSQIVQKDAQIRTAAKNLAESEKRVLDNNARLATLNKNLKNTKTGLSAAVKERNKALREELQLDEANAQLTTSIEDQKKNLKLLEDQLSDLHNQRDALTKEFDSSQKDLNVLRSALADEQEKLSEARQNFAALQQEAEQDATMLASTFGPSRFNPMIYSVRQEITRLPVGAHLTPSQAQAALDSLLVKARLEAARHGAAPHKSGTGQYLVADLYDRQEATVDQVKKAIVQRLAGNDSEQVLVAKASANFFLHEPVALDVDIYPNPIVYEQDQVITEAEIEGASSTWNIYEQLSDFLSGPLKSKLLHDKMVPRSNSQEPLGSVPGQQVFDLVQKVKEVGRNVRVQALALNTTRAADSLKLEFRLR